MSVTYLFRGLMKKEGKEVMVYETKPLELGFLVAKEGLELVAQMQSTTNYSDILERPLYECDLVELEGEEGLFIIEHSPKEMAFVLEQRNGSKKFLLRDKIDSIKKYKGTLYDKDVVAVYNEREVTF